MAVSLANYIAAHAVIGSPSQVIQHYHDCGDTVYRKSDFTQAPGAGRTLQDFQYIVMEYEEITFSDSGTEKYASKDLTIEATCVGAPYSPATDQLDDITTPFYYTLKRIYDNKIFRAIHETDVYTPALISAYIQTNLPNWWNL